ncbi:MAG TPA: V-type ATPase 116kDa subunit family protein, partial [Gaiellaceae bacterium]|nr:V-type ATPase 116kDa subunit family protein [Gaiellaceae bacterium]
REALVAVADSGSVELAGTLPSPSGEAVEALRRVERAGAAAPKPRLAPEPPDTAELERLGAAELLAGEVELERRVESAVRRGSFAALVGWTPQSELETLSERLALSGGVAVELPRPSWAEPPTLIAVKRLARPFRPLVETYGSAHYADVDPTLFTAASFVLMFGMMFGDVGHGLLVAALALWLRGTRGRFARFGKIWPLPFAAGLSAAFFGLLYGECFGPTGIVPALWLNPIDEPLPLLAAAVAIGAALLANGYAIGTINRWREEGAGAALVAASGIAGTAVFLGGGIAAAGWYFESRLIGIAGAAVALTGVLLMAAGVLAHASRGALAGVEVSIEVVDSVVRIGSSVISFTRLAAFGLMHAALSAIVWDAASAAWGGLVGSVVAIAVFLLGNAIAFSLELLVASIQALRLEYYELFSRIFAGEGRPFSPWHIPLALEREGT